MKRETNESTRRLAAAAHAAVVGHDFRVPWGHLMALARQVEQEAAAAASGCPTTETTLRLARAVLMYQQQMLGHRDHRAG